MGGAIASSEYIRAHLPRHGLASVRAFRDGSSRRGTIHQPDAPVLKLRSFGPSGAGVPADTEEAVPGRPTRRVDRRGFASPRQPSVTSVLRPSLARRGSRPRISRMARMLRSSPAGDSGLLIPTRQKSDSEAHAA